jgi:putative protease
VGDEIEIVMPSGDVITETISEMWDDKGEQIQNAPHAQMIFQVKVERPVEKYSLVRRRAD